jgi:UDP-N-acetylglucosamine 3-dehydrogenase
MRRITTAAVIGAGAQGAVHAHGLGRLPGLRIAAVADPVPEAAARLAATVDARACTSLDGVFAEGRIDLVSICAPAAAHPEAVDAAVAHGVRAIHCEKPLALTYGDATHLVDTAARHGVVLTINHQRRFDRMHRSVRDLVSAGGIGDVVGAQGFCANLFDWGSHTIDLLRLHLGDPRALSVLAQIDVAARKRVYGALTETASIVKVRFDSAIDAVVSTGRDESLHPLGDNGIVLSGTRGRVEIFGGRALVHVDGAETRVIAESVSAEHRIDLRGVDPAVIEQTALALADLVDAVETGRTPVLDARHGLAAAEIVFAAYESSLRRGLVRLPLDVFDNALQRGLDGGAWRPETEIVSTF